MKLLSRIQRFMNGRYGADELYKFLFGVLFIVFIVDLFIKWDYIVLIELFLMLFMCYRLFSKNIHSRRKENDAYLNIKKSIIKKFKNIKKKYNDRKYNVYVKCNKCKTTLKLPLPKKMGINHALCPECEKRLTIVSLRKQKVEVIKKGKE